MLNSFIACISLITGYYLGLRQGTNKTFNAISKIIQNIVPDQHGKKENRK